MMRRTIHDHAPDVVLFVDRRVGVDTHIAALIAGGLHGAGIFALTLAVVKLARVRHAHHDPRHGGAHHAMGVVAVHGLVGEPVDEIGRLNVVRGLANGHHVAVAVDLALLELDGDATVGDVAYVAVV